MGWEYAIHEAIGHWRVMRQSHCEVAFVEAGMVRHSGSAEPGMAIA